MKYKKDKGNNTKGGIVVILLLYFFISFLLIKDVVHHKLQLSVVIATLTIFSSIVYNGLFKKYRPFAFANIVGFVVVALVIILAILSNKYEFFRVIINWPCVD